MDDRTRVNLTLPPEVLDVLDRLGKVTGAGRATIVREWLLEGLPLFAQVADAAEMAHAKNIDALKIMAETLRVASDTSGQLGREIQRQYRAARRKRPK